MVRQLFLISCMQEVPPLSDEKNQYRSLRRENKLMNRKALRLLKGTKKAAVKEAATVALQEVPSYDVKLLNKEIELAPEACAWTAATSPASSLLDS